MDGVVNLLQNLNPHKATGPDGIPAHFLERNFTNSNISLLLFILQLAHETQVIQPTYMVLYGTCMSRPFKTCLAFFPLPYFLYTPLTLMARFDSDAISPPVQSEYLAEYRLRYDFHLEFDRMSVAGLSYSVIQRWPYKVLVESLRVVAATTEWKMLF